MSAAPKLELNLLRSLTLGLEADKFGAFFLIWTGLLPVLFAFIIFSKYGQISMVRYMDVMFSSIL